MSRADILLIVLSFVIFTAVWEMHGCVGSEEQAVPTPAPTAVAPAHYPGTVDPPRGSPNFDQLPLPEGVTVRYGGCTSDGVCFDRINYYWAGTREVVLWNEQQPAEVRAHEFCHAHQHWTIVNEGMSLGGDYAFVRWAETAEGRSYAAAIAGTEMIGPNLVEDFAMVCADWYTDKDRLVADRGWERYGWAKANLP